MTKPTRITWDDRKAEDNARVHKVTFEEAETVLGSLTSEWKPDVRGGEERFNVVGYSNENRILFVVTVVPHEDHYHIISARKATRHERKRYQG